MNATATAWLGRCTIDPLVAERWPSYSAVLVVVERVDQAALAPVAAELLDEAEAHARVGAAGEVPHVERWRAAYRDFGVKPRVARSSVDALLRRAVSDAGLPRINPLVDLYNAVSVLEAVPIGGEDLDRYAGPARLVLATGDEPFLTRADGEPVVSHPEPGEPVWVDDEGVTCRRWNWRQTTRTAIDGETGRAAFIVDSLDAPDHAGARRAADRLAHLLGASASRVLGDGAGV